jgi:nitrogen fixation-related uncharacterized protein
MNRGIALAIILIIGLVIYLMVDSAQFDDEREAIKATIYDLAVEAESINILPTSVQVPGKAAPTDVINKKVADSKEFFSKYFAKSSRQGYSTLDYFGGDMSASFEENNTNCSYVTSCKFEIKNVSRLKKLTSNYARGNVRVRTSIETIGNPRFINLFMPTYANENAFYNSDGEIKLDKEKHTYTSEIEYNNVVFRKVAGEWKVAEAGWYETFDSATSEGR